MTNSGSEELFAKQPPTAIIRPAQSPPAQSPPGSETVINPERRRAAQSADPQRLTPSALANRLFPLNPESQPENELAEVSGITLGHFELQERIGMGGMGSVFMARDTRLQRTVALKVLAPSQTRDVSAVLRFQNEARAAAQLDHDNIARVFYIGDEEGLYFIAFEFVTGTNIRDLICGQGRLTPEDAVNYALQIAAALKHTSAAGIVHRDIKPSNIIITTNGRAKLVDLGLARKDNSESAADLTLAGTTLGTFDYISPEQAKDPRKADVRSDIYSLGCTIYHMLTGEPPYPTGTVLQKLLDHQASDQPDPAEKNPAVSPELSNIVRRMMHSDPRQRYATPDELIADLVVVADSLGLRSFSPDGLIWASGKSLRRGIWGQNIGWFATAVVLFVIVAALQFMPNAVPSSRVAQQPPSSRRAAGLPRTDHNGTAPARPEPHSPLAAQEFVATPQDPEKVNSISETPPRGKPVIPTEVTTLMDKVRDKTLPDEPFATAEVPRPTEVTPAPKTDVKPGPDHSAESATDSHHDSQKPSTSNAGGSPAVATDGSKPAVQKTSDLPNKTVAKSDGAGVPPETRPASGSGVAPTAAVSPITVSSSGGEVLKRYNSLEAACLELEDGNRIELRFDGVHTERKPIQISKRNITIRGAEGFRPVIEFVPDATVVADSTLHLITVSGGSLTLNNVNLRLTLAEGTSSSARGIALFSLNDRTRVVFNKVSITVDNPNQNTVEVFQFASDKNRMLTNGMMPDTMPQELELELSECLLRGGADLFAVRQSSPLRLLLRDSICALDGTLLTVWESNQALPLNSRLDLRLAHVTCRLRQHLISLQDNPLTQTFPPLYVDASNSVFSQVGDRSLIAVSGDANDVSLTWRGSTNFYDGVRVFWSTNSVSDQLDFEGWLRQWGPENEVGAHNGRIRWAQPEPYRNLMQTEPSDCVLHPEFDAKASDEGDVGAGVSKFTFAPLEREPLPPLDAPATLPSTEPFGISPSEASSGSPR